MARLSRFAFSFLCAAILIAAMPAAHAQALSPDAADYPPYAAPPYPQSRNNDDGAATPDKSQQNFQIWLQGVQQDAIAAGIASRAALDALKGVELDDQVIDLDQSQPEHTITFDQYGRRIVGADRVATGRAFYRQDAKLLANIGWKFGVPPSIIVALWGIESNYGRDPGHFDTLDALATLAYRGQRPGFFRKELIDALRMIDRDRVPPGDLQGSWAGAMGQCQFMPSTYLRYAVDDDGNGFSDIWHNQADIFASIGHYLAAEGWKPGTIWGREVELTRKISARDVGLGQTHTLGIWNKLGVRKLNGKKLPEPLLQASLIQPDGAGGRSFLVYDNFRALMKWNRSTYFATAVGLLADRIAESR
ncbi:MAG TPA: lytic murein transglycosylase [Alphaproteobacteria bacterium]|nr:lytic murein transglycosylase [Alphaproteobacteria bacterium]